MTRPEVSVLHAGGLDLHWTGRLEVAGFGRRLTPRGEAWETVPSPAPGAEIVEGYVWSGDRCVGVVRPGERLVASVDGAWALGTTFVRVGGAAGRSQREVPCPVPLDTARLVGGCLLGLTDEGDGVSVDLATGAITRSQGWPLAADVVYREPTLWVAGHPLRDDLRSASCARSGHLLAGPGGRTWDLLRGRPLSPPGRVRLGATCALLDGGFATVDWATHEGWRIRPDGAIHHPFRVPLDDDDLVVALVDAPRGLVAISAEGRSIHVDSGHDVALHPAPPDGALHTVDTPWGPLPDADHADLDGRRYAWSEDGWLLTWPVSIS